jgi:hypothetical protein
VKLIAVDSPKPLPIVGPLSRMLRCRQQGSSAAKVISP